MCIPVSVVMHLCVICILSGFFLSVVGDLQLFLLCICSVVGCLLFGCVVYLLLVDLVFFVFLFVCFFFFCFFSPRPCT